MAESKDLNCPAVFVFGDSDDRVIETASHTGGKSYEIGYYNGVTKPKAIVNISTGLGCPVGCNFCELTESGRPLKVQEMVDQVVYMVGLAQQYDQLDLGQQPLKVNTAKTGEPLLNQATPEALAAINEVFPGTSFKCSTSLPNIPQAEERIRSWARFARQHVTGSTQLQISLISTDDTYRRASARARPGLADIKTVGRVIDAWREENPEGRIPNCSLLLSDDTPCDPADIQEILPPENVRFRIRPVFITEHADRSGLSAATAERISEVIKRFEDAGYTISTDGVLTETERANGLVSNVTRERLLQHPELRGIWHISDKESPTLLDTIAEKASSVDEVLTALR